tara:strand:- start:1660 stop:2415 length:756 start_codon:yes stop_codon:yes gene_type:complete
MKDALLPKSFKYNNCKNLIRIGGRNDGGYLIVEDDLHQSNLLLSFGINTDWKFEEDFQKIKSVPIIAYDYSTSFKLFLKKSLIAVLQYKPLKAIMFLYRYYKFRRFFSRKNKIIRKFVGLDWKDFNIPISQVLERFRSDKVFIKMDIEGSEYRCLDELLSFQENITGIIIEFHDVDLHLDRIQNFIANFDLNIAHIHANNSVSLTLEKLPMVLEITFSKYAKFEDDLPTLPNKLDSINNINEQEIKINFNY